MEKQLGKLERLDLRPFWESEARGFTPWLAQEKNLKILCDAIDMELEFEAQEKEVGPFQADILCKNVEDNSWVLIENQIERTDHKHLGQLLTYAAGLEAVTIVWIAAKFTEEHRAALDWLNKITPENFRFFGLEIELWKISDPLRESLPALKFNVVSKPNAWSRTISQAAERIGSDGLTGAKEMQYRYWMTFVEYLAGKNSKLKPQGPQPQHWLVFRIGRGGFGIHATINTREKRLGVELYISADEETKAYFHLLKRDKSAIEAKIGATLEWMELPKRTASRIVLYRQVDFSKEPDWPAQHQWLMETIEKFDKTFRPRIQQLEAEDWEPDTEAAA